MSTTGGRKSDAADPAGELDGTTRTADPDGDRTRTTDQAGEPTPQAEISAKAPVDAAAPSIGFVRRRTAAPWREHALTSVADLRALTAWLVPRGGEPGAQALVRAINGHLGDAERAAEGQPERPGRLAKLLAWIGGIPIERAMSNLDAAEVDLLRLAPREYLRGQMPSVLAYVRRQLRVNDPQRVRVEEIARRVRDSELTENERSAVVAAVQSANFAARGESMRVRSFRNMLFVTASILALGAIGVAVFGALHPTTLPLCFTRGRTLVCPTSAGVITSKDGVNGAIEDHAHGWDLALVEGIGIIAAAVAAAASLREIRGTSTPYSIPVALAVLKLPTGALTAFLGLVLMRGEFVPGLSALDFPAQIIAWAVVFGYAQQLFTRFVDQRAQGVLNDVGGNTYKPETA